MNVLRRAKSAGAKKTFAELEYLFEMGKGRMNVLNTILLLVTMAKVFDTSWVFVTVLVVSVLVSFFLLGLVMTKIGLDKLQTERKVVRNTYLVDAKKNTDEILRILKNGQKKL